MINFNAAPYFDDYDENKGFYKILFRPSVAVQARELNQMQTILQKQIDRFGSHIFKDGSIVLGGAFDLELDIAYVKAGSVQISNLNLGNVRNSFVGKTIVGSLSGVRAYVRAVDYDEDTDNYVFMVRYTASSQSYSVFLEDELVNIVGGNDTFVVESANATGIGSIFTISQGALFFRGYFLAFPSQTIVLEKYTSNPTLTVGFKISETVVTEVEDNTLLDNALGSYNENAPGAHRYKFDVQLLKIEYDGGVEDPDFVKLLSLKNGVIETTEERTQYSRIYEELAKRTFDESGDYYVRGLNIVTREHLNVNNNEGLFANTEGGNSQLISIDVDPGIAYVKGYERNILTTQHVITEKSTDYDTVNESVANVRTGGYILIKEITGSPILDNGATVNLYGTAETRVTNRVPLNTSPTTSPVGTARVKGVVYESGMLGAPNAVMRVYLYDVKMSSGAFSSIRAIGVSGSFFADVVLTNNNALIYDQNQDVLLFYVGSDHTRSLKDEFGSSDTTFTFFRTIDDQSLNFNGGLTGIISASVSTAGESLAYSDGSLSTSEKRELILSVKGSQEFSLPGTVSATGNVVSGLGTFFTRLNTGDRVRIDANTYYISTITNDTNMSLTANVDGGSIGAGNTIFKSIINGDVIDLTAKGSSGATRTATVSGGVLTVDIKEDVSNTTPSNFGARLAFRVSRAAGSEVNKTLRSDVYIKINCSTISNTAAPIPLGLADVYRLKEVRIKTGGAFSNATEGSDITSSFILDNGQRDNLYDHASIVPKTSSVFGSSNHLLVKVDHFESDFSSGFGYFSVDSYPIDDSQVSSNTIFTYQIPRYKSTSGTEFNLRNVLDFRPYKANTANSSTTVAAATTNPAYSNTGSLKVGSGGLRIPTPDGRINLDYSYYLARRDVVALDKNGVFTVIKGQPSKSPVTPSVPDNIMGLGQIYISPYPSITEKLARVLNIKDNACISVKVANIRYTMREIGVLKNRIENLEYYTALTLLEKSALDLKIVDANGLDRFKNGFFVDGFLDHSLGATYSADYNIAVDRIEQSIRPIFEMDSYRYNYVSGESSGVVKIGNLVTLPFTETTLIDQPNVTSFRNIEQSVYRFIGVMQLTPDGDVWVDSTTVDKTVQFGNEIPAQNAMSTEYGSWQSHVTGYNLYDRKFGDRSGTPDPKLFVGSFTSYAAALEAAKKDKDGRFLIETVTTEQRTNVNTIVTSETQTQELGSFVTDASLIPYIRPQVIRVLIQGLKARTRFYTYFDGENMSDYITPFTISNNNIIGATVGTVEGAEWRSDDYGNLLGLLRLPAEGKRFRTGTKEIIVTDSPTNAIDATSYSKGFFTAQGLSLQKQNTILSTQVPVVQQEEAIEQRQKQITKVFGPSCMAYSFKVDVPLEEEGIFLTSADVFIESMHPTLGVWFEIREMNSDGGITRNQIPYSEVWMRRDDPRINLNPFNANRDYSVSPLIPTRVNFPSPVFLYNNTQYAFVIHTEGLNPDTYFYVSRLGETDLRTGNQVTSRRLTGNLFTTNNNLNYDLVPDVDLLCKFNRANFTAGSTGTAILGNSPTEFFSIADPTTQFLKVGEKIYGSNRLTLTNLVTTGNSIIVGDRFVGSTSGTSANLVSINGSNYDTDGFTFINSETISVRDSSNTPKNITATVVSSIRGEGELRNYNESKNLMILDNSNGLYFANCKVRGEISNTSANLSAFSYWPYSTTNLKPHYLKFNRTLIDFEKRGFDYIGTGQFTNYIPGAADSSSDYDTEVAVLSRNTELSLIGGQSSSKVRCSMSTQSIYVSPVVDVSRANAVYVHNLINDDITNETLYTGGNLINKYISKTVTLANGQDAEDLIVKLTAYRPPGSTVKVWIKIRNGEDGELFDKKPWIELDYIDIFSSKANKNNFLEFDYTIKPANLNNGTVFYVSNGITYSGFKQFAIKIGLMGTNSALVPRVGDLRVIALQK